MAVLDGARAFGRSQCGEMSAEVPGSERKAKTNQGETRAGSGCAAGSPPWQSYGACGGETPATGVPATGTAYLPRFLAQNVEEVVLVLTEARNELCCRAEVSASRFGGGAQAELGRSSRRRCCDRASSDWTP